LSLVHKLKDWDQAQHDGLHISPQFVVLQHYSPGQQNGPLLEHLDPKPVEQSYLSTPADFKNSWTSEPEATDRANAIKSINSWKAFIR